MISSDSAALVFRARGDTSHAKKEFSDLEKSIDKNVSSIDSNLSRAGKGTDSLLGGLLKASAIEAVLTGIAGAALDAGKALLNYNANLETLEVGFETLLGSGEKARAFLQDLTNFGQQTPFDIQGLAQVSQRLLGVGIASQEVIPLIKDIGNVVAATGKVSAERLEGISNAIGQVISKQKVSAEEMEQLAERGVPAWQILSEAIGKTVGETRKLAEQGKISSDDLISALQKVSRERFGDALEKQSETFQGSLATIEKTLLKIGADAFKPLFNEVKDFTKNFAANLKNQEKTAGGVAFAFGQTIGQSLRKGFQAGSKGGIFGGGGGATQLGVTFGLAQLLTEFAVGVGEGVTKEVQLSIGELRKLDDAIGGFSAKVKEIPPLSFELSAEEAKKQLEAVEKIVEDLTAQIAFFGDESAEAAVKQQLIAAGVTDLSSALAQNAITLARQVDQLNAAKKLQEEYNDVIKKHKETLDSFVDNAFKDAFPEQSELDRFNNWVKDTKADMGELRAEVAATRTLLQGVAQFKNLIEGQKRFFELSAAVGQTTVEVERGTKKLTSLEEALLGVAKAANLAETESRNLEKIGGVRPTLDVTEPAFVEQTRKFVADYQEQLKRFAEATKLLDAQIEKEGFTPALENALEQTRVKNNEEIDKITAKYREFLDTLKTVDKEGKEVDLFAGAKGFTATDQINAFIAQILELDKAVAKSDAAARLEKEKELAEELLAVRRETLEAERDLALFREAQQRKILVNTADSSFGTARIEALQKLEQFDRDAATRAAIRRAVDIDAEEKAALKRIEGKENEEQLKFEIEELFRNKRLLSEQEFQEQLKAIREGAKVEIKEAEIEADPLSGFAAGIADYLSNVALVQDANGQMQFSFEKMFSTITDLGLNAFASLTAGFGEMVSNWVLYGNTGGQTLQKLAASVFAQLAAVATQYALMCLAAAAFATTGFGAAILGGTPAQFLYAAAAFGVLAVGAALAGRGIAGDSFNKGNAAVSGQTSGGFGSGSQRGEGGEIYTTNRDKQIIDLARNTSQTIPDQKIQVEIIGRGGIPFDEFFHLRVKANGKLRDDIKKLAHG